MNYSGPHLVPFMMGCKPHTGEQRVNKSLRAQLALFAAPGAVLGLVCYQTQLGRSWILKEGSESYKGGYKIERPKRERVRV